ncbi:hypothetical protein R5W23_005647 [Gemmata sp. JC673]|uniref:Uncharacterized protein n=1 Tax=Gemmata algarum TaxID=2975278 RepID=A0ABU5EVN8_9BACT|nr:hypothetical protein [Gemmata algarum]MDY3558527.1 hypothetical protein [Gemmata algarum]
MPVSLFGKGGLRGVEAIGSDPRYTSARHFAVAGCNLDRACELLAGWRGGALGLPAFEYDGQRNWCGEWSWGEARGPVVGVNVTQVHEIRDAGEWAFLTGALAGATTDVSLFWAAEASPLVSALERELPSLLGCPVVKRRG